MNFLRSLLNISQSQSLNECNQRTRTLQDLSKTLKEKSRCLALGGKNYRTVFSLLSLHNVVWRRLLPNKHNIMTQSKYRTKNISLAFLFCFSQDFIPRVNCWVLCRSTVKGKLSLTAYKFTWATNPILCPIYRPTAPQPMKKSLKLTQNLLNHWTRRENCRYDLENSQNKQMAMMTTLRRTINIGNNEQQVDNK